MTVAWTLGSLMFYGGIAGAALTVLAALVIAIVLKKSRKGIIAKLNAEYGGDIK
jgi:hypothetical protein